MSNLNLIIEFHTFTYLCFTNCSPIYRAIASYFNVIFDYNNTYLRNFSITAVLLSCISKTIAANYTSRMDSNIITDNTIIIYNYVRKKSTVFTYTDFITKCAVRMNLCAISYEAVISDFYKITCISIFTEFRIFSMVQFSEIPITSSVLLL